MFYNCLVELIQIPLSAYLASSYDIMAPVVWSTAVAPLTSSVGRTDTLPCVIITVISHMTALTGCKREEGTGKELQGTEHKVCRREESK